MKNNYIAVIQAGGKGTRMQELTNNIIPKPMLELNGKPMIQWQIESLSKYGIKDFVIILGYLGEKIREYFGDGEKYGVHISYIEEQEPLGSAGALFYLREISNQHIILVFGDVMFELEWNRMIRFHERHHSLVTLLAHPNAHPYDSDLLIVDKDSKVTGLDSKHNIRKYWYDNCVNAGIYILDHSLLDMFEKVQKKDLEKDVILPLLATNRIYAYITPEYVKDVGTPDRFRISCVEQREGVWSNKSLQNKQRCIFLDRDGTINVWKGLISNEKEMELEPCAISAIRKINESGYLAIVVTNQPVVARGMCSIEDVEEIHRKMKTLLGNGGAYLDDIVFCPHHPDKGYSEENPVYKMICNCRKPAVGMIDKMVQKYNIDTEQSWVIGDSTLDIQLGVNAGLKTALVLTGQAGNDRKFDVKSDIVCNNLLDAVQYILDN